MKIEEERAIVVEEILCLNCANPIMVHRIEKGTTLACDCGCVQKCLGVDEDVSRWRVMNPFDLEGKRPNRNE